MFLKLGNRADLDEITFISRQNRPCRRKKLKTYPVELFIISTLPSLCLQLFQSCCLLVLLNSSSLVELWRSAIPNPPRPRNPKGAEHDWDST